MTPRYLEIARRLRRSVTTGVTRPGQRMISARRLALREEVSLPTAVAALRALESEGLVVARARSGYFVSGARTSAPTRSRPPPQPQTVGLSATAFEITSAARGMPVSLGAASPNPDWLPLGALRRSLNTALRRATGNALLYSAVPGDEGLRHQLALLGNAWGADFSREDVIVTHGATQALRLALRVTCRAGDIVAVESPTYFGLLTLLESLGIQALEVPTDPVSGLDVPALGALLERHAVAAVIASPTVQNPLGAIMPLAAKRALVSLLERARVPLIEDDVYGDLAAGATRPPACKAFDGTGNVLYCSSVSKTLAPGWRGGWIAAGRYADRVLALRWEESLAGSPVLERALAEFLASGDYRRHLKVFRPRITTAVKAVAARVQAGFPPGTRISRPVAGYLLWVELPETVDAREVYSRALSLGIGVAPGQIFSPRAQYTHHLRLSCAQIVSPKLLHALDQMGALCCELGAPGG
jgi:DNA-binding transcriptional MocR family regulator